MQDIKDALKKHPTKPAKKYPKKSKVIGSCAYLILCSMFVFSVSKIPFTYDYSPIETQNTSDEIPTTFSNPNEPVNKMEGAFQAGAVEGEYEEVLKTVTYEPNKIIFIGGARFEPLNNNVLTDVHFITDDNDTIEWLKEDAEYELDNLRDEKQLCVVSVGFDNTQSAAEYAEILNKWTEEFPSMSFAFVGLGPVDEALYHDVTNNDIQVYNSAIKSLLNDKWRYVDLYEYLADNGIESEDGRNYSDSLNTKLFTWILNQVDTEEKIVYIPIVEEGSQS